MLDLWKYINKNVQIITTDGEELVGRVQEFFDKDDFDSDHHAIELVVGPDNGFEVSENDIKSIELV